MSSRVGSSPEMVLGERAKDRERKLRCLGMQRELLQSSALEPRQLTWGAFNAKLKCTSLMPHSELGGQYMVTPVGASVCKCVQE